MRQGQRFLTKVKFHAADREKLCGRKWPKRHILALDLGRVHIDHPRSGQGRKEGMKFYASYASAGCACVRKGCSMLLKDGLSRKLVVVRSVIFASLYI